MDENELRQLNFVHRASKRKRETAAGQASTLSSKIDALQSMSVKTDISFPLVEGVLQEMQVNLDSLADCIEAVDALEAKMEKAEQLADYVRRYSEFLNRKIEAAIALSKGFRYIEAIHLLENVKIPADLMSFRFVAVFNEVSLYLQAGFYHDFAEYQIAHRQPPLSEEQFAAYSSLVQSLPVGVHDRGKKYSYIDHLEGLEYLMLSIAIGGKRLDEEAVRSYASRVQAFYQSKNRHSKLTIWRFHLFHYALLRRYNEACRYYFEEAPEYKNALALFHAKTLFFAKDLEHPAFVLSETDEDFRIAFLTEDMIRKDDVDLKHEAVSLAASIRERADVFAQSLARAYLSFPSDSPRRSIFVDCLQEATFTQRVYFADVCFQSDLDRKTQLQLIGLLGYRVNHIRADLEKVAPALVEIKGKLDDFLIERFDEITDRLYRSPKAIKIATKTPIDDVRKLSNREIKGPPKGKSYPSSEVKGHSLLAYLFGWLAAILIPLVICFGAALAIYLNLSEEVRPYALLAPALALYLYMLFITIIHFGNDERGSAYVRRYIGVLCLLLSIVTFLYFAFPQTLSMISSIRYTLIIGTAIVTVFTQFVLKEYRQRLGFWIYWPSSVLLVASLGFLIFDLMNGLI